MNTVYDLKTLHHQFKNLKITEKLSYSMSEKVTIIPLEIKCLKSTKRSGIYKLLLQKRVVIIQLSLRFTIQQPTKMKWKLTSIKKLIQF